VTTFAPSVRNTKRNLQFFSIDVVDVVYPNAISISGNTEVSLGKRTKLNVSFDPITTNEKALIWSSADENIATVDQNGVVTGISLGTTTITATAFNKDVPVIATFEIAVVLTLKVVVVLLQAILMRFFPLMVNQTMLTSLFKLVAPVHGTQVVSQAVRLVDTTLKTKH